MFQDYELKLMADIILHNLSYLKGVSRTSVLSESAIKYPLIEYAERRLNVSKVLLEYSHPIYKYRRCDMYIEHNVSENPEDIKSSVLEFKYIRENTHNEFQSYFDDLIRLRNIIETNRKAYFVVCGETILFNNQFRNYKKAQSICLPDKKPRPSGPFSKCLSFSIKSTRKEIDTDQFAENYTIFREQYKCRVSMYHPERQIFSSRLVCISESNQMCIAIWEIIK